MTRISIIGDSLSMPRPDNGVDYNDTYSSLLSKKGFDVVDRSRRSNDTNLQSIRQHVVDDILYINPDIVIVLLGIMDCAPRIFTKIESRLLNLLPNSIKVLIIKFLSKHRYFITKHRRISYVDQSSFRSNLENIISSVKIDNRKIILINFY